jgi:hypothetical protein
MSISRWSASTGRISTCMCRRCSTPPELLAISISIGCRSHRLRHGHHHRSVCRRDSPFRVELMGTLDVKARYITHLRFEEEKPAAGNAKRRSEVRGRGNGICAPRVRRPRHLRLQLHLLMSPTSLHTGFSAVKSGPPGPKRCCARRRGGWWCATAGVQATRQIQAAWAAMNGFGPCSNSGEQGRSSAAR